MKITISKSQISNTELAIRRCGYGRLSSRMSREVSYVRRIRRDLYPRFHVYIKTEGERVVLNLHLDQRAPVYAGVTAHAGEYEGEVVEREGERIKVILEKENL